MTETDQLKKILTDAQKSIEDARKKTTDTYILGIYNNMEKVMNGKKVPKSLKICGEIDCEDCAYFEDSGKSCEMRLKFEGDE